MGFASAWLERRALFPKFIKEAPDPETGLIIIVPAYNETKISDLLNSLSLCKEPECKVEVIIVVNAPENADFQSIINNEKCLKDIESWKKNHKFFFRLFTINITVPPVKGWGVGLARKTGMDEAVRRLNALDKPEGVIVNLDADCIVARNYLSSLYSDFLCKPKLSACSIYFEHQKDKENRVLNEYITWYELHLRYFLQGIMYAGFPYAFHTVGSCIAVKAGTYIKAGGMNRRQAGEDFYFVQKLVPAGGYFALNTTAVYPSPRISSRVPFGTGATITRLISEESSSFLSYNIKAFTELAQFFSGLEKFYFSNESNLNSYNELPESLRFFINEEEWNNKIFELKSNTSNLQSFRKRFFSWFNMFKIVKYMNLVHTKLFEKVPVNESASALLLVMGHQNNSANPEILLDYYRSMERQF